MAWMRRALALARGMRGHVWPNPPVGCVIVKGDVPLAQSWTQPGGRPHAEAHALALAGPAARGATLYVTLEPCCHWGATPPCTQAIIAAGIRRVCCAMLDPDPRVNGGGLARLRAAGIGVTVGVAAAEAAAIMSGFLHRIRTGRPELCVSSEVVRGIPDGMDAVMSWRRAGCEVKLRSGEIIPMQGAPNAILERLGARGLTRVAVTPSTDDRAPSTARHSPASAGSGQP